jgi:archaellum biogenesis ATPase FlaH
MSTGKSLLAQAKSLGFSDRQIAALVGSTEDKVRALRSHLGFLRMTVKVPAGTELLEVLPVHSPVRP